MFGVFIYILIDNEMFIYNDVHFISIQMSEISFWSQGFT